MSTEEQPKPLQKKPLIPENIIEVPSQRLYYLSLGVLIQAIKFVDLFRYLFLDGHHARYAFKWLFVDFLYCAVLSTLRIPRLDYAKSVVLVQILSLWLMDGFLFGAISINLGLGGAWSIVPSIKFTNPGDIASTAPRFSIGDLATTLGIGGLLGYNAGKDTHLLGQHTVRMSPISTAQLNPYAQTFCIASPGDSVLIPLLLNNTSPTSIKYLITPLGYDQKAPSKAIGKVERFELSAKELKAIEASRQESLEIARVAASAKRDTDDYDEYDDDEEEEASDAQSSKSSLQRSQSLVHVRVNKPGVVNLERVMDSSDVEARLVFPTEISVVPCPTAVFSDSSALSDTQSVRCAAPGLASGSGEELELSIDVYGVPPLSLRWIKDVNGRREPFMVEGIEGGDATLSGTNRRLAVNTNRKPEQLAVPLTVSLDALGKHSYILESVTDALGNTVSTAPDDSKTIRSINVLKRPSVAFKHCGPGNPAALLIGSDTALTINGRSADSLDYPLDVQIKYNPPSDEDLAGTGSKKQKPWVKTLHTQENQTDLSIRASIPGEYSILKVHGKYCEGDVLSPDTCQVVERPIPTAEIEWKKIHECSGDTGVSASLVLHGTPPFHVYYSTQKDKETAREDVKVFPSSRGELTIQPERSGHYIFRFTQLSDANYKKVALNGPSIDQVVHAPASADFAHNRPGMRGRKKISSCSGDKVDVEVDLKGTGPWNVDLQVVGPRGSEIVRVGGLKNQRERIQVAIPPIIDKNGGSFEIDLVGVEDAYGCKRPVSVPGVVVNVRRVKPTAKFYGAQGKRKVTILEGEQATLPLRLTGDGPWRLKYRRAEAPHQVFTATLNNPNDELRVSEKGSYEITEISDSQCPGAISEDNADYLVDWISRPIAKLSPEIETIYEPYNGSHILLPICEGNNDHVDLELTGRPPFQIMYNVATDAEAGGTKIIDQPTFSSIQPRTRFQLHTSEAARIYYEVKQIGDAAYPLAKNKNAVIPRSQRLVFEQQVLQRPSARFKNRNRITYCLNDALTPHDNSGSDGVIQLSGTPPFRIKLSIKNLAASETQQESLVVPDYTWKLNVPSYIFKSIGPHQVTIDSVQDVSGCEQTIPDPLHRSIWLDVAETAAIVPFDRREHYCMGDVAQFQLEGTPPWAIGYRINGKLYNQEAKVSPFAIKQEQPGEFAITSIAHQQKMCRTAVTDLRYTVHPLPSAQVGHGKRIIQDIHEGDQAEIVFTLIGEPPFTFTYQRAELSNKKGVQGKVLETHTVSGVTTKEYSIFSALEGTWTVTFISDRYCRYPPAQPDGTLDKTR
ncbi:hypothetical protein BDY19DRAFT_1079787 [Irpex rosettiformis]|uniref:Uncharacterized protein n=1 Tax=Irpex rosettiformis TaxID=378272 RepID=A0ACB8UJ40_9APHY|nr:hypothetical protein BDY19DRAFT_1079787 [Irpex rosettiformis]